MKSVTAPWASRSIRLPRLPPTSRPGAGGDRRRCAPPAPPARSRSPTAPTTVSTATTAWRPGKSPKAIPSLATREMREPGEDLDRSRAAPAWPRMIALVIWSSHERRSAARAPNRHQRALRLAPVPARDGARRRPRGCWGRRAHAASSPRAQAPPGARAIGARVAVHLDQLARAPTSRAACAPPTAAPRPRPPGTPHRAAFDWPWCGGGGDLDPQRAVLHAHGAGGPRARHGLHRDGHAAIARA